MADSNSEFGGERVEFNLGKLGDFAGVLDARAIVAIESSRGISIRKAYMGLEDGETSFAQGVPIIFEMIRSVDRKGCPSIDSIYAAALNIGAESMLLQLIPVFAAAFSGSQKEDELGDSDEGKP